MHSILLKTQVKKDIGKISMQSIYQLGEEKAQHVFPIQWADKRSTDCHAESEMEAQVSQIGLLTQHSCPGYSEHPSLTSHDAQ